MIGPDFERNSALQYRCRCLERQVEECIRLAAEIIEYTTKEYRSKNPGARVHARFPEGYSLFLRLRDYKENELLFLHDLRVPANNSLCERPARVYKRKQKQAVTFRSQDNLGYICDGLSVVYLLRVDGVNVYRKICEIYERQRPPKEKEGADVIA